MHLLRATGLGRLDVLIARQRPISFGDTEDYSTGAYKSLSWLRYFRLNYFRRVWL